MVLCKQLAAYYHFNEKIIIWVLLLSVLLFEWVRIRKRLVLFAQRQHEATHLSSFGWGMIASCLVLLFASKPFALPHFDLLRHY